MPILHSTSSIRLAAFALLLAVPSARAQHEPAMVPVTLVNALWGKLEGTPAFYAMIKLQDGEFGFDPDFRPGARRIHDSSEALLLEGLRRLDEGL